MMMASNNSQGKKLVELLGGFDTQADIPAISVAAIKTSTLGLNQGDAFLAVKGVKRHGIDYAINADKSGASIVLYDSEDAYANQRLELLSKQLRLPLLGVSHFNENHGEILSRLYDEPSKKMTVIGVTGTDGKTSVTHLLTQALIRLGYQVGSIGTLGIGMANQLKPSTHTTPDAAVVQSTLADFYQQGCQMAVMEVSSHALDQYRVVGCAFDMAILTNLGSDHLDYHQDLVQYANVKERLFHWDSLSSRVINAEDAFGKALSLKFSDSSLLAYSACLENQSADVQLKAITPNGTAKDLLIATSIGDLIITSHLIGGFNIDNILALVTALIALDCDAEQIISACSHLQAIPGRMQVIKETRQQLVIVDFAHTEQALEASLLAAKAQKHGKLWCVFGCGGDRDASKRAKMGAVAERLADHVVITDDNPRTESPEGIVADILAGCVEPKRHHVMHDRRKAIEFALSQAKAQDTILIAGKGHEQVQIIEHTQLPFSDAYVAKQYFKRGVV